MNGQVILLPLDTAEARQHFTSLIETYVAGLRMPLPFAVKTALVWLTKQGGEFSGPLNQCPSAAAITAAQKTYEGDSYSTGEMAINPYLQRTYPSFEGLWSHGDFTVWAERLLAPLRENVGEKTEDFQGNGGKL